MMAGNVSRAVGLGGAVILLLIGGCAQQDGISRDAQPFDGIAADEKLMLLGNEPFWGFEIIGETAVFSSADAPGETELAVTRFAGNNGLGFSGELNGAALQITVTPGECSDTMSDRSYPFTATITLDDATLFGCGYTDRQPFSGPEAP